MSTITKDQTVNLLRAARENIDKASLNMVTQHHAMNAMYETIHDQAVHIETLGKRTRSGADLYAFELRRGTELRARISELEEMNTRQQVRLEEMKSANHSMIDRLTVMGDARQEGVTITPRQANWMVNMLNGATVQMQDLAAEGPNLVRTMKINQMERMENVCRLASAAIKHLTAAHGTIPPLRFDESHGSINAAIDLLTPLATGVHDTHKWEEDDFDHIEQCVSEIYKRSED